MIRAHVHLTPCPPDFNPRPALENPAVAQCQVSWERAYRREMKLTKSRMLARKEARDAFHRALPALSGLENIGNFISCVAFAIATGVFVDSAEARLLDDAQLALHALARRLKKEWPGKKIISIF
jgi:hypothetical protein